MRLAKALRWASWLLPSDQAASLLLLPLPTVAPQASVPETVAVSPAKAKAKPQGLAAAVAAGLSAAAAPETRADEYAGAEGGNAVEGPWGPSTLQLLAARCAPFTS